MGEMKCPTCGSNVQMTLLKEGHGLYLCTNCNRTGCNACLIKSSLFGGQKCAFCDSKNTIKEIKSPLSVKPWI